MPQLCAGSEGGGKAAAIAFNLIETAKLNDVDPQAWLTWVLSRRSAQRFTPVSLPRPGLP